MNTQVGSVWLELIDVEFEQRWIDAGGVKTRCLRAGPKDASAVIMLPGTAGTWETFSRNIRALSKSYNVHAIDTLGAGFTGKPDHDYELPHYVEHVRNFMAAAGLERAALVGVSLGSWISARFAITHPEKVTKVILISPAGMTADPETMKRVASDRSTAAGNPSWDNLMKIFGHLIFDEKNRWTDVIAARQRSYEQPGMSAAVGHILCLQKMDVRQRNLVREEEWRKLTAPTLVFGSTSDRETIIEKAQMVTDWMPNAKIEIVHNVGHWPHFEEPEIFNKLALDFLKS